VEDDDVDRIDAVGVHGDVVQPPLDACLDSGLAGEPGGFLLVAGEELEVDGAGGAAF
jgi:hypothetical protein